MATIATEKPGLTPQQKQAIFTRDVSVALSAGAGCGKTFVLTERFLSHLEDASADELGRFVAITFTDRAAREMRDRIRHGCQRRQIAATDDATADRWLAILRDLDSARVSTIHSFCGALLRAHAVEAGLDPRFQTLDAIQSATLRTEFLDDQLRELLARRDKSTMDLVVQFGLERLKAMIGLLLDRRQQIVFDAWKLAAVDDVLERWRTFHAERVLPAIMQQIAGSPAARTMLRILAGDVCGHKVFRQQQACLREMLPRLAESQQPAEDLQAVRDNAKVQGAGTKRDWYDEQLYLEYKDAAEVLRKLIDKLRPRVTFDPAAARPAALAGLQLLELAAPIVVGFQKHKQKLGCLDFDDLLIRAKDLLSDPRNAELRHRLSRQIELLLVDESQDTDPLQVELIEALCGDDLTGGKLFFVGDFKQSIYRFRRADPRVFRALEERMPLAGRLPLSRNFRSQPAILCFVNALFCGSFDERYEPLVPHRRQVTPTPAVEFLWYTASDDDEAKSVELLRKQEAEWIARRLRAMLDGAEPLVGVEENSLTPGGSATRAVQPGDIAILFRALSDVADYEEALRRYGIPYYLVGGKAFYAQQEIHDLLNLLRSLASSCDDVSLAGLLRSPFFSLADETIFWLAQHPGGLSGGLFAQRHLAGMSNDEGRMTNDGNDLEQVQRVAFAAETLRSLRSVKDRLPIADLIHEALARTGYDAVLLAEFLGERKLANLHKLIEQARSFDRTGIFTLADFITQLSEFVAQQPDEPLAATHPESTNVVRLMSIHQSKGLEFPVVVVPDLDRRMQNSSSPVAFSAELGPLVKLSDGGRDDDEPGITGYDLHAAVESLEEAGERIRLLYVATTRAADYLLLSAGVKKLDSPGSPWMQLLAERFDLQTGRFLGTLPPGYDPPGPIRVTRQKPSAAAPQGASRRRPLVDMVEQAADLATSGTVVIPQHTGPIVADPSARRQFSFSRLSGALEQHDPIDETSGMSTDEARDMASPRGKTKSGSRSELPGRGHSASEPDVDPIRLGTLVHEVLAVVPLQEQLDAARCVRETSARRQGDTPAEIARATELLARFFRSPRAADLRKARRMHRELEFLMGWPPRKKAFQTSDVTGSSMRGDEPRGSQKAIPEPRGLSPRKATSTKLLPGMNDDFRGDNLALFLQGFVDCLYEDVQGEWHLLDYKTNQVDDSNLTATAEGYALQLQVYALAVERTFGRPPASCTLHFLRTGQEVPVQPADEQDLVRRVSGVVEKLRA